MEEKVIQKVVTPSEFCEKIQWIYKKSDHL